MVKASIHSGGIMVLECFIYDTLNYSVYGILKWLIKRIFLTYDVVKLLPNIWQGTITFKPHKMYLYTVLIMK